MSKLKELDLYDDAIIVFVGDHGWQLGELKSLGKLQFSDLVPLLIKYQNKPKQR